MPTDGHLDRSHENARGAQGLYALGTLASTLLKELGRARARLQPLLEARGLARAQAAKRQKPEPNSYAA